MTRLYKEGKLVPWSKGKTGVFSEEVLKQMSASQQGIPLAEWKKFTSFEPYTPDFNNPFKEKIRERDNYCCVVCNNPQEELNYKLHTHHCDYNKLNSFFANCVSLCRHCHIRTNSNRASWKSFFQTLLKERYGYEYTLDQKIILDFTKNTVHND